MKPCIFNEKPHIPPPPLTLLTGPQQSEHLVTSYNEKMTFDMYARCSIQHVHGCEAAVALVLNCIGHVHVRTIHMAPSGKPWDWYCFAALGVILGVKASCFLQETRLHFNLFDQDDVTRDNCQPTPRPSAPSQQ